MRKKVVLMLGFLFVVFAGIAVVAFFKNSPVSVEGLLKPEIELKMQDDRINVLLLGIGGGSHEGPMLTDTIIFASIDPQNKKISMVSIPRDLWSEEIQAKVNTAYAFGEEREKGGGLKLAKAVIEKVVNQQIDYAIRIDFDGFVKAVDMIGGIDVNVERTLDDYEYPVEGKESDTCGVPDEEFELLATASSQVEAFPCRYMHLHIDEGQQHMDGKTALMYVRSRHAVGVEGSDFARSKRQEKIIEAFRNKIFSLETVFNPSKIISLYDIVKESIDTDVKQEEFDDFIKLAQKLQDARIVSTVLDIGDNAREGLLINPPITEEFKNQWVLIPKSGNGNYTAIHAHVDCIVLGTGCPTPTPSITTEN